MTSKGTGGGFAALLVVPVRGLVLMVTCAAFLWTLVGGETVTCEGNAAAWECSRRPGALLPRVLGVGDDDVTGPEGLSRIDVQARRRFAATMRFESGESFRLPWQPTADLAESDRALAVAWVRRPRGALVLAGPTQRRFLVFSWTASALTAAALVASGWARWRPGGRQLDDE